MREPLSETGKKLHYRTLKVIYGTRALVFEQIHRTRLKQQLNRFIPDSINSTLLRRHLQRTLSFPLTFSLEITNHCNAKCWFCPQPFSKRKKGFMAPDLFRKIMDEIGSEGEKVKSIALFMDGEPTLHKRLVDYLKYARRLRIKNIYLSSNMEFFTPELTENILNANLGNTLQYVICSLDGADKAVHGKSRIGIDFKKAVLNTEYLIEQRNHRVQIYPWVFTRLLVSDVTKDAVLGFKRYWSGKADKVLCYQMHNWGGLIESTKINLDKDSTGFSPCYFPFSQFAVQYDGTVRLCCVDAECSVRIGDLNRHSIKDIWNGERIKGIRHNNLEKKLERLPPICTNCSYPRKGTWIAPFFWDS